MNREIRRKIIVISNYGADVENLRGPKLQEPLKDAIIVKRQSATMQGTFVADPVPDAKW